MQWTKRNKVLVDQYKIYLRSISIVTTKNVKEKAPKVSIKYKVPPHKQGEYSAWFLQQINIDVNFEQHKQNNINLTDSLNYIIDYLQKLNSLRYLTEEIKIYIKRMLLNDANETQVSNYITEISARISYSIVDPITKKLVRNKPNLLPISIDVTLIVKVNKRNYKSSIVSLRQPVVPIIPTAQSSIILLILTAQSPTQIL